MSELVLSVGLAQKLETAFNRNGWALGDVDKLCEGSVLADVRRVLLGHASVAVIEHLIDLDADPFNPWAKDGWTVEHHQKGGTFKWKMKAQKKALYLSSGQKGGKFLEGHKLCKELEDKEVPVLNANALDYLLAHPHLIPKEWKGQATFFWGTRYRNRGGYLYVRYLYWDDDRWDWSDGWLDNDFYGRSPAAVRAS